MAELLLDIPFGDVPGSTVAQDYGPLNRNAAIYNGDFVPGVAGRAVQFGDSGHAEIIPATVPLNETFSLAIWIKAMVTAGGPSHSWITYYFGSEDRRLYLDLKSSLTSWSYLTIYQHETYVAVYVNGVLKDAQTLPPAWGKPLGFALLNDTAYSDSGYSTEEGLRIYRGILDLNPQVPGGTDPTTPTLPDPPPGNPTDPTHPTYMLLNYYVNGTNFKDFGVYVNKSNGLLDNLDMKEGLRMEWPGMHGEVVDLSAPRYEAREFTLRCLCIATGSDDFIDKYRGFMAAWMRAGTQRLMLLVNNRVLVFEVYVPRNATVDKSWSDTDMIGQFDLLLREPEPVKRVLKFSGTGTASITVSTTKPVNIYWGDGTTTKDVYGNGATRSHGYSTGGDHYIIVSGVIEDLTGFSSNASVIWSKY